jgi:transcriptional regulator with XRE-family HTH domain
MPPANKANLGKLRRDMENAGCSPPEIAQEMQRVFSLRPREAHRHAYGWSQDEAAHHYNVHASQQSANSPATMTGARISAYERWPLSTERPTLGVLAGLAGTYGVQLATLIDFEDRKEMPAADRAVLGHVPAVAPEPREAAAPPADAEPLVILTDPERTRIGEGARQSALFAARAGRTNVGPTMLEQLEADVESIAIRYLAEPLVPLVTDMLQLRNQAWELLEGRQYPEQTKHLYLLAGQTCGLLASACSDLGQYEAADTHARTASLCADLAGHDKLRAWIANTQSLIAFWGGRPRRAAEHASRAAEYARGGVELARARSFEARALARLGDADGTRAAITAAIEAREHANDEHAYVGMFQFPVANQQRCAGSAMVWLGRPADGVVHLEQALNGYGSTVSYAHTAVTRLDLVLARLQLCDLDGAREQIGPVLALPEELRLAGVSRRGEGLQRLLTGTGAFQGSAVARDLAEEIEDFLTHNAARALPGGL